MAVVLLVALRVTIGWHFLYEGVWKIANPEKFSAASFLTTAKGPAAPLFYAMVHDIDGRERLARRTTVVAGPL
ncbi:MAG TPA: DoxX family protein, partial [Thermoguttaceae bacterium]|nr:DoxX family protein [Thermoguttaceae bacterium]